MASFDAVESQYDAFPYPQPTIVAKQLPIGFSRATLNFLTRRRAADWFPASMRIWVAGCGTQQAAMWALSHPEATIVATDLSDTVLGIARSLATQLNITNVQFEKQNLADAVYREEFDLVVSTGVIHHMPDPTVGAASIRGALKPNGAAILMVYNKLHRAPLVPFREAHQLLCAEGEDDDERFQLASELLDAVIDSPRCKPVGQSALEDLRKRRDGDRAFVADALLHPLEHTYDIPGLLELLQGAGLRHTSWRDPDVWELSHYIRDEGLLARAEKLDEEDRWRVVVALAGRGSPLLEVIAEPTDSEVRRPYQLDEILRMRVVRDHGVQGFGIEEGRVTKTGLVPAYELGDDSITGRSRVAYGPGRAWQLPLELRIVLDAFEHPRSIGDVLEALGPRIERAQLLRLIAQLLPCEVGILAPVDLPDP
jgi:SAM-dependent methyltransferase